MLVHWWSGLATPHFQLRVGANRLGETGADLQPRDAVEPIEALRERGFSSHERGDLCSAEDAYRQALRRNPDDLETISALGALAVQTGRYDLGLELLGVAVRVNETAEVRTYLGNALAGLSRTNDALASYQRAIAIEPRSAPAHINIGHTLRCLGREQDALASYDTAIDINPRLFEAVLSRAELLREMNAPLLALEAYDRAIAMRPDSLPAHINRGIVLRQLKRFDEALAAQDVVLGLQPDDFAALANRTALLLDMLRFDEALAACDRTMALWPGRRSEVFYHRAAALSGLERHDEALEFFNSTLASRPDDAAAYGGRAAALQFKRRHVEALADCDKAIALAPQLADAHFNRGVALTELKRIDEALGSHRVAAALRPDDPKIQFAIGCLHLLTGRYELGWTDYTRGPQLQSILKIRRLSRPVWTGVEDISGRALFVHTDQGLGDAIQFARYVRLAEARGARVVLAVQRSLHGMMRGLTPTLRVLGEVEAPEEFDYHCPLSSLPGAFGTSIETIPAVVPYLHVEPHRVEYWKKRIGTHGYKVGICWHGSRQSAARGRSFALQELRRIASIRGVRLLSLQKSDGLDQLASLPDGMQIETLGSDYAEDVDSFSDTAAVMECLDLVITCDTSIAHLAGALARPTWIALNHVPDWRWGLAGEDSAWYPTSRLFRQTIDGSWGGVFDAIHERLSNACSTAGLGR